MTFRFLPPSPQDERAAKFLLAGTVLSLMTIGALLPLVRGAFAAVLWGAAGALAWSLWRAQRELDRKRKRAGRGLIQLNRTGLLIADFERDDRIFAWEEIKHLVVGPGKLEIHSDKPVEILTLSEIESAELLVSELKRRVRLGSGASDFIPLSPM